jgi:DNA primase
VEFRKANREGRVFLDTTRNGPGAHIVAAYSPRARAGAPVSFPVKWDQLEQISPRDFTITTVPPILREHGDLWAELMPAPQTLPKDLLEPVG